MFMFCQEYTQDTINFMMPVCRLLANLYSGNVYIWSTADQVRQALLGSTCEGRLD